MLDVTDPQSWNAYSYVNNNPLDRVDPDGKGFWDKLKNAFRYGYFVENDQLAILEQQRREWLNQHYYERDDQGNWRPYDSSKLSTQDVFDKYGEAKFLYDNKQLHALSDKEILEANRVLIETRIPIALTTGSFNTVGHGLKNLRPIGSGRLKGFSRANTELSGGSQAAKETFKQLTVERKPAGGSFGSIGNISSTSMIDITAENGSAYLYKVCAADGAGNCSSGYSNIVLGARFNFPTDPTITSIVDDPSGLNVTTVTLEHITELRTAVNAVRHLAGLPDATWTHPTLTRYVSEISKADVEDLRVSSLAGKLPAHAF